MGNHPPYPSPHPRHTLPTTSGGITGHGYEHHPVTWGTPSHTLDTPPHLPTLRSVPVIPRHDLPARYGGAMIPRDPREGRPDQFLPGGWKAYEVVGRGSKGWKVRGEGRKNFLIFRKGWEGENF